MSNTLYNVKERKCCKCRQDLLSGNFHGGRYYDDKGIWDGKSWVDARISVTKQENL